MTAQSWKRFMSLQNKEAFQIADLSEAGNKAGTWPDAVPCTRSGSQNQTGKGRPEWVSLQDFWNIREKIMQQLGSESGFRISMSSTGRWIQRREESRERGA